MTLARCIAAGVVLLASTLYAQERPALTPIPNTILVGADGKYDAAPDTALIQFNISAQADTAKDAYDQVSKQAETTRQILRNNGIDPKSAEIGFSSLHPNYDWKSPKHKVTGYQVSTSVSLKLREFSKIGPIVQQLADANLGESSQSLSYTLENLDEAKGKAVADAYRRARTSAQSLAAASGRVLGNLSSASVDTFENRVIQPMRRAMAMGAQAGAPAPTEEFSPENVTVTAHVNAMFELK